ncbi:hypothetical protein GALL_400730 [mine drainage metagenome]|uniref:Uncharacterized protein n=1 Tax=mine drainage metagenome TaxID=410659 RepID=A0A1J5QDZ0_9ZZZZ
MPFDLLQRNHISPGYGFGNARQIVVTVAAEAILNIVTDKLHVIPRKPMPQLGNTAVVESPNLRIPWCPVSYADNIRSVIPGHPVT